MKKDGKRLVAALLVILLVLTMTPEAFGTKKVQASETPQGYFTDTGLPIYTKKVYEGKTDNTNYQEPSASQILNDYKKSSQYGKHPRIMITKEIVDNRLKPIVKAKDANDSRYALYDQIIERADNLYEWIMIDSDSESMLPNYSYKYEKRMQGAGGNVSDQFKYKLMVLGLAYQLSDEEEPKAHYKDAAWKLLERITDHDLFNDINPWHNLDFGTFSQGLAIGYDWFYDAWDSNQKKTLEEAMVRLCFEVANESYATNSKFKKDDKNQDIEYDEQKSKFGTGTVKGVEYNHNHNSFVNSGIIMVSLALMDKYPNTASTLCQDAFRSLELNINEYYPSGLSNESPQYWLFSMDNFSMIFSSLETAIGKIYGLDNCRAMKGGRPLIAIHALESDVGTFTFGDTDDGKVQMPGELYFYKHYNLKGYNRSILNGIYSKTDDFASKVAAFIWATNEADDVSGLSRDWGPGKNGDQGVSDFASFRSDFGSNQSFVGIKAGRSINEFFVHLDQGSFVFHSQGVKWAVDLGKDNYDLTGYYDKENKGRWKIFRLRPDGHNTLLIKPNKNEIGFNLNAQAVLSTECSDAHAKAVVDMTNLVSSKASKARRGFLLTDDRRALVVRDEVTLKEKSDVYWVMYTPKTNSISRDGKTITLTGKGSDGKTKTLTLDFLSDQAGELVESVDSADPYSAAPWSLAPAVTGQSSNSAYKRIVYKVPNASGNLTITVKMTPGDIDKNTVPNVEAYGDIDSWDVNGSVTRLKIEKKTLRLQDTISIDFMIPKSVLSMYHDPYLIVNSGDKQRTLTTYREAGDYLAFDCRVAPQMIGDEIVAIPHAKDADQKDVTGEAFTYSVAQYCYNMLNKDEYQGTKYATFRRLLVDILRYGDASQKYLNYKTGSLASSKLTNAQEAMGTDVSVAMTYGSVKEKNYKTVNASDALASIESAALYLEAAVNIRYKFSVSASISDPTALRIVITDNADCTNVIAEYPVNIDNRSEEMYYVTASCLNAIQMKKTVYATVMKGNKKVSNTYRYSIESYAASVRGKEQKLDYLMDAMMRYGNSAADFAAGK